MIVDENGTPVERFLNDVRLVEDHYYSVRNDKVQRTFALNEDRLRERRSISAQRMETHNVPHDETLSS